MIKPFSRSTGGNILWCLAAASPGQQGVELDVNSQHEEDGAHGEGVAPQVGPVQPLPRALILTNQVRSKCERRGAQQAHKHLAHYSLPRTHQPFNTNVLRAAHMLLYTCLQDILPSEHRVYINDHNLQ